MTMRKFTKSQKQMMVLAALLVAIVVVLAIFVFKPTVAVRSPYVPKVVDTRIPDDLLRQPEYRKLNLPVELPLVPGRTGRSNPFEPYR